MVAKTDTQDSSIATLDSTERVEELARMLGGKDITAKTRQYAEELTNGRMSPPVFGLMLGWQRPERCKRMALG